MITYLFIGVIYSFIMHLSWDHHRRNDKNFGLEKWTLKESLVLTVIWPLYLLYFIYSFFKGLGD